jgi:hypothetical protein
VLELRGGIWGDAVWLGWLELRALNLAAMIDYFSNFLAYFQGCANHFGEAVDKFQTFCSVFVYFCLRAGRDAQWQPVSAYFYGQTAPKPPFVRNPVSAR